jgi:peptidoglycan/LPS O-acetylase OafA/YrhL
MFSSARNILSAPQKSYNRSALYFFRLMESLMNNFAAGDSAGSPTPKNQKIKGLDGLRAISIVLVLLAHISRIGFDFNLLLWRIEPGRSGVTIFFVISGFLITLLLLRERETTGKISLGSFYRRRALRILPAYFAFLLAMLGLSATSVIQVPLRDFVHAAAFLTDYSVPAWSVGHTWSLSVEEQFYLTWPTLALILRPRYLVAICVAAFAVALCTLTAREYFNWSNLWSAFELHAGKIACGCIAAIVMHYGNGWVTKNAHAILAASVVIAFLFVWHPVYFLAQPTLAVWAMLFVLYIVATPSGSLTRMLEWRPLAWLGTLSYSIYLWQQPFFDTSHPLPWWLIASGLPALALASHYAIERPFIRWGRRAHPPSQLDLATKPRKPTTFAETPDTGG